MDERRMFGVPFFFILPALILLGIINVYPFFTGIYYSFFDGTLINLGSFIALDNYIELFKKQEFLNSLSYTLVFSVSNVIGSYVIGMALALLLNKDIPGRGVFRVLMIVPWVLSPVVSVVGWRWMIGDEYGLVNVFLSLFGVETIYFLADGNWAQFSTIVLKIWRSFPFMMISLLAGMQSIDRSLYEAASIDGAGKFKSFIHITLPQLSTITTVLMILMSIYSFNDFETVFLLTEGGPASATQTFMILSYRYSFGKNLLGMGSAIAVISLFVLVAVASILLRRQRKIDGED